MSQLNAAPERSYSIYTPEGRRTTLIAIVAFAIFVPVLITAYLEPVLTFFPIVAALGIYLVRTGRPSVIPTWIVFNIFSCYLMIYAAYSFGTLLRVEVLVLFLIGMLVYDVVGVKGGQMQSLAGKMISWGIPLFIMVPHTSNFSFDAFREILREDGLEGLHGSDHGVSMLGIGDGFLPGALAVSAGALGAAFTAGPIAITIPQLGAALGGIISLALLMWLELPRAIAALIMSVPGALLGLTIGLLIDPGLFNFLPL